MSEIKTRDMRAGKRWQGASEIIEAMQAEINELRAALAERDAKLAALEKQEPVDAIAVDDMSDGYDKRYGRVLVATENCIKPLYAAAGAAPEPTKTVDRAWSRFCGCIGRGPDAPYPGMIEAFESHYGQNFTDKDWRNETGIWAAAWGYATRQAGAAPVPQGRKITATRIANHLKKSPLGDISMYRDGFFDGAKWAEKEAS